SVVSWPVVAGNLAVPCLEDESGSIQKVSCRGATMKAGAVFTIVVFLLCISGAVAQKSAPAEPYNVDEAYQVYSVLLPNEKAYGFAKGTVVIRQETVSRPPLVLPSGQCFGECLGKCLTVEAADKFKEAISDFDRMNSKRWLLQRQLQIQKPYELMSSDTITLSFKKQGDGWDGFYKRHPSSGGFVIMSAVGFNKEKTRAIVYTGSDCGPLCGWWSFHLLEKVGGKWQEAPGVICH